MKKIIVITRRENEGIENDKSLGFINEHNISKYTPYTLDTGFQLFEFWSNKLCARLDSLGNTDDLKKSFNELKENYLLFNVDYCLNIYQRKDVDIFVYHQWLDKQGLGKPYAEGLNNLHFLSALRQDILKIKKNETKEESEEYEFNWLIHDSDLLDSDNYDGLLWFEGKNYTSLPIEDKIPKELEKDNVWSFIHDTKTSKYYMDYIIDFEDNTYLHTAEDFYNNIAFDKKSCLRRMELLGLADKKNVDIDKKRFIFQNETWAMSDKLKKNDSEILIDTIEHIKEFLQ
jgi:hypothetical protein